MGKLGIVFSRADPASMNVFAILREQQDIEPSGAEEGFAKFLLKRYNAIIYLIEEDIVDASSLKGRVLEAERLIFVSRHKAASKMPAFLVHFTGMWNKTTPPRLSIADAELGKALLRTLVDVEKHESVENFAIGLEATHHGPVDVRLPMVFIEIGSSEAEWKERFAAEVIYATIEQVLKKGISPSKSIIGFGGTHYAPTFTRIELETEYAVGHILPKYAVDNASSEAIIEAIEATRPRPTYAVIDWKGLNSSQRSKIISALNGHIEVVRAKELRSKTRQP